MSWRHWHNYTRRRGRGTVVLRLPLSRAPRLGELQVEVDLDALLPRFSHWAEGGYAYVGVEWGGLTVGLELRRRAATSQTPTR